MRYVRFIVVFVAIIFGCTSEHPGQQLPEGQLFTVQVISDQFVIFVKDPETIRLATDNYNGRNQMFPIGQISRGDGGFNQPWSWHLVPETVRMTEVAVEVCDGRPSYVETHLDDYIQAGSYCPWSGKIVKIGK